MPPTKEDAMHLDLADSRLIVSGVVVLLLIIVGVALDARRRGNRTAELRRRFGREYDRSVLEHGSKIKAEAKLASREARVERLRIRNLGVTERERFVADWNSVQSHFVDRPKSAVTEADELV